MRIMTVRQPWAWAIIHGGKDVENRTRNIAGSYRGPVAIHAAQGAGTPDEFNANCHGVARRGTPVPFGLTYGAIIGVVDLVDVHLDRGQESEFCSEWADTEVWHLVFENPRPLREPIPFKGALGLRKLDDETTARVWEAIA